MTPDHVVIIKRESAPKSFRGRLSRLESLLGLVGAALLGFSVIGTFGAMFLVRSDHASVGEMIIFGCVFSAIIIIEVGFVA